MRDFSGQGWIWLIIMGVGIWYWWPSDQIDTESASFRAGDNSGYQRGYYDGAASVCRRLDETAPDIASNYRRRNVCN